MLDEGFLSHLEALRKVLFRAGGALILLLGPGYFFAGAFIRYLRKQAWPPDVAETLYFFTPLEPFIAQLKLGFFIALFLSLPYIAVQIYRFAAPGLYARERACLKWSAGAAFVLFLFGAAFCYCFMLPLLMKFAYGFANDSVRPLIGLAAFLDLAGLLLLAFGIMFEFPLAVLMLIKLDLVPLATFRKQRPVILIVLLVVAALLTPPDVFSQILLAAPTYLLFEAALFFGRFIKPSVADGATVETIDGEAASPVQSANHPEPSENGDATGNTDDAPYRAAARLNRKRAPLRYRGRRY